MKAINRFLLDNDIRIANNPCVSPDYCLDWVALFEDIQSGTSIIEYPKSLFETTTGKWLLLENAQGDHAWRLTPNQTASIKVPLKEAREHEGNIYFPTTFENLISLKNLIQEFNPNSAIFPTANESISRSTLGIGARFTTLHWPGIDWAMANLGIGLTANQNSIPRELVFDVDVMLADELDTVPFPFIGSNVPEGHQGQSVEGMSHGSIIAKLKTGFHKNGIAWSFNADHQPIGGKFDSREDQLVAGCLFASYITFDLSPELAITHVPDTTQTRRDYLETAIDDTLVERVRQHVARAGVTLDRAEFDSLLCYVWSAMKKMKRRDDKYRAAREKAFTTEVGRKYLRELSIDELPGLTTRETTAIMLALCEAMDMPIDFIAPAFGFQKNVPYPNNDDLRELIAKQWSICQAFDVSIGFHSGSGKSAENYQVMGSVTGRHLEIKTSGRYTYEMGVALSQSTDPDDHQLWLDWYVFTRELAIMGAFGEEATERKMAREFIVDALRIERASTEVFDSPQICRAALEALNPSPEHMFWFEYNFLYVLAADGKHNKACLGDHSPAGYRQRARFYSISDEGLLRFAKQVAAYVVFLAENTGLVKPEICRTAKERLNACKDFGDFIGMIGPDA